MGNNSAGGIANESNDGAHEIETFLIDSGFSLLWMQFMYFCTNPPLYLLVASVTMLFDVRRHVFCPRRANRSSNEHQADGYKAFK